MVGWVLPRVDNVLTIAQHCWKFVHELFTHGFCQYSLFTMNRAYSNHHGRKCYNGGTMRMKWRFEWWNHYMEWIYVTIDGIYFLNIQNIHIYYLYDYCGLVQSLGIPQIASFRWMASNHSILGCHVFRQNRLFPLHFWSLWILVVLLILGILHFWTYPSHMSWFGIDVHISKWLCGRFLAH